MNSLQFLGFVAAAPNGQSVLAMFGITPKVSSWYILPSDRESERDFCRPNGLLSGPYAAPELPTHSSHL